MLIYGLHECLDALKITASDQVPFHLLSWQSVCDQVVTASDLAVILICSRDGLVSVTAST